MTTAQSCDAVVTMLTAMPSEMLRIVCDGAWTFEPSGAFPSGR